MSSDGGVEGPDEARSERGIRHTVDDDDDEVDLSAYEAHGAGRGASTEEE